MTSLVSSAQRWSACLGNLFEHYDRALFGFLSPFLAPLIFPEHDPIVALFLTYAMMPLGMIARPLGALFFGYIGDKYGRKHALLLALLGMAVVSLGIALTPTYSQAGAFSALLFGLGRGFQHFLAAGEVIGGAIFLLEGAEEKRHDFLSGFYSASTMGGHLLASLGVFLLCRFQIVDPGWRFLYLGGCATAIFGCILRRSPRFEKKPVKFLQTVSSSKDLLWRYRKTLLGIAVVSGFAYANYAIALVLMNGLVPLISPLAKDEVMGLNTYLLVFDLCALPFFGWLGGKFSRDKLMLLGCAGVVFLSIPLFLFLKGASILGIIGVRVVFTLFGVVFFAPFHAWVQQLVPFECRYLVISVGYALGSQLLGSPTAAFALWCFQTTGELSSIAWYWIFLALGSAVSIMALSRSKQPVYAKINHS